MLLASIDPNAESSMATRLASELRTHSDDAGTATARLPRGAAASVAARYQDGAVGMTDTVSPLQVATFAKRQMWKTYGRFVAACAWWPDSRTYSIGTTTTGGFPQAGRNGSITLRYAF